MKLVVMISGNGSNLQAILRACQSGDLNAKVLAVVSDQPSAYGLERAHQFHIPTLVKPRNAFTTKDLYEQDLSQSVMAFQPDWIVLAGWMRLLTHVFLDKFPKRVINIHPALPQAFPGINAVERAYQAYQEGHIQETGVMVHLVPDEGVDNGPVLKQAAVPIMKEDTLETLTQRVHEVEHKLLVETLIELENF